MRAHRNNALSGPSTSSDGVSTFDPLRSGACIPAKSTHNSAPYIRAHHNSALSGPSTCSDDVSTFDRIALELVSLQNAMHRRLPQTITRQSAIWHLVVVKKETDCIYLRAITLRLITVGYKRSWFRYITTKKQTSPESIRCKGIKSTDCKKG